MPNQRTTVSLLVLAASLAAQERDDERKARPDPLTAAWQRALEQAKTQQAPILAFVLPPADAKAPADRVQATWRRERDAGVVRALWESEPPALTARDLLLRQIQLLRAPEHEGWMVKATHNQALFALTIPVVVAAELCGARRDETVVLLGPDGRRVQGFALDLVDAAAFCKRVGALVLEPKELARRASVPAAIARDLVVLRHTPIVLSRLEDQALSGRLASQLAAAAPALVGWAGEELDFHPALVALENDRPPLGTEAPLDIEFNCLISCGMMWKPPALTNVLKLIGP